MSEIIKYPYLESRLNPTLLSCACTSKSQPCPRVNAFAGVRRLAARALGGRGMLQVVGLVFPAAAAWAECSGCKQQLSALLLPAARQLWQGWSRHPLCRLQSMPLLSPACPGCPSCFEAEVSEMVSGAQPRWCWWQRSTDGVCVLVFSGGRLDW